MDEETYDSVLNGAPKELQCDRYGNPHASDIEESLLIGRIGRAIGDKLGLSHGDGSFHDHNKLTDAARAAIEAVREEDAKPELDIWAEIGS